MKNRQKSSVSGSAPAKERQQQARDIMQQLITEGLFAPDEAAEITFSDTTVICTPEQPTGSSKNEKTRNPEIPGSSLD